MEITEKDLEDLIFDDLLDGGYELVNRNFNPFLVQMSLPNRVLWARQVQLPGYGVADIIGYSRFMGVLHVDIYELKNQPLKSQDFEQVLRYKTAVREALDNMKRRFEYNINCSLVGPSIESGHFIHNFSNVKLFTFTYSLRGIEFEWHSTGWRNGKGNLKLTDIATHKFTVVEPPKKGLVDINEILETPN
jgi:hypothetical protein